MSKFKGFNGNYKGLNDKEIKIRREKYGFNELEPKTKETLFHKIICIFKEPMFALLLITSLIYFLLGDTNDGLIMIFSVVFMAAINIFQQWRTDKTLEALQELSTPKVMVIRNERIGLIESRDITVDDLIIVEEGDKIPADGIIIEMFDLGINESTLTGESDVVWKKLNPTEEEKKSQWQLNYCYEGTSITQGKVLIKVAAIGPNTEYGKIGTALLNITKDKTPLEQQINKVIFVFASIGLTLSILVMLVTYLNSNADILVDRITQSIISGITLAMSLIPEEFPVVLTVFLAMGAWRLAQKNALIKKMPAVETLGAVSVLCVDKTGTLTQNKMTVQEVYHHSYKKDEFLTYSTLSCEVEPYDPMEKAILKYVTTNGINKDDVFNKNLIGEYAFLPETKMMGHIWEVNNDTCLAVKGSPEGVLELCELTSKEKHITKNKISELTGKGYRVIAVAKRTNLTEVPLKITDNRLEFLGLIALEDPPREAVYEAVKTCYKAGIRLMMITGDHVATAVSIASKVGIRNTENYLSGHDIDKLSDQELKEKVKTTTIFARVIPSHKMRIVKALKANGEIVAMTGDGVNDAPALKYADIGIAMGKRGTNVAKEASDMILLNDDFTTIVDTIKDGRRIYDNIKKAIGYIFAVHIPIASIALLTPVLGLPLLLLPVHIVLFELIIDPTCSIVFERHPAEKNIMSRKPRSRKEDLITKELLIKSIIQGSVIFVVTFAAYIYQLYQLNWDVNTARTISLLIMMLSNLFLVYVNHSEDNLVIQGLSIFKDKVIILINLMIITALAVVTYTPFGNSIAKTTSLPFDNILIIILIAFLATFWYEFVKIGKKLLSRG